MVVLPSRNAPAPPMSDARSTSLGGVRDRNGAVTHRVGNSSPMNRGPVEHDGPLQATPLAQFHEVPLFPPPPGSTLKESPVAPSNSRSPAPGASDAERELWLLYGAVLELSDQLEKNRGVAFDLAAQASRLRAQANHAQSGFPLRRFNLNLSEDVYASEIHSMTCGVRAQNAEILQDNRALASLIREHESTLETVMTRFRKSALENQKRELSISRTYESVLLAREERQERAALETETRTRDVLSRLGSRLRSAWRTSQGEVVTDCSFTTSSFQTYPLPDSDEGARALADWSLERECELARLERENADLRRMIGQPVQGYPYALDAAHGGHGASLSYGNNSSSGTGSDDSDSVPSRPHPTSKPLPLPGSPELAARRLVSLRGTGVRVASPFAGTGGSMGIGLRLNTCDDEGEGTIRRRGGPALVPNPIDEWPNDIAGPLWRDGERRDISKEMREALLS
ncbi:hypothetical protein BKA62DRAFT_715647 [Auriculariales sp. MPI-PUGE-AT-0066]|nr:hypothetical protein BKA62DRAFT_715647 [Auriculariales sp. MPI-PUGE-AT-0066]